MNGLSIISESLSAKFNSTCYHALSLESYNLTETFLSNYRAKKGKKYEIVTLFYTCVNIQECFVVNI